MLIRVFKDRKKILNCFLWKMLSYIKDFCGNFKIISDLQKSVVFYKISP